MMQRRFLATALCIAAILVIPKLIHGAGGTSLVATKGQPAYVLPSWPAGVAELINDPLRASGWNSWFSEWPNDVNQYAFEIKSSDDLNRLIAKLASIKFDIRQVRLSYLKEPSGLGWVTRVPEGNGIAVVFSIGDQSRIDEWFKRVRKPFGVMEFTATPVAVPPTLTIFVQNESVNLDNLEIPEDIEVSSGYVPKVFHRFNTTIERQREKEAASRTVEHEQEKLKGRLDDSSLVALKNINAFLESRKSRKKR